MGANFIVEWEALLPAANERVNPSRRDNNLTVCSGYLKIAAGDEHEAKFDYLRRFPGDRVKRVTKC